MPGYLMPSALGHKITIAWGLPAAAFMDGRKGWLALLKGLWRWAAPHLTGAGLCMAAAAFFALLQSGGDLFEWLQAISFRSSGQRGIAPAYWACVYLYGIPYSILVRTLFRRVLRSRSYRVIWLAPVYPLGGYLFFALYGMLNGGMTDLFIGVIIAGTAAAVVGVIFYCGTLMGSSSSYAAPAIGILLPALLATAVLLMPHGGFARGWMVSTPAAGEAIAMFEYLNGERPLPAMRLEAGQRARYELVYDLADARTGGAYGMRVEGPRSGWTQAPPDQGMGGIIESSVAGAFRVFVYGDRISGTVRLKWEVEDVETLKQ